MKSNFRNMLRYSIFLSLVAAPAFGAVTVLTVPFTPSSPAIPHTAIIGVQVTLGATVNLGGSTDTFHSSSPLLALTE